MVVLLVPLYSEVLKAMYDWVSPTYLILCEVKRGKEEWQVHVCPEALGLNGDGDLNWNACMLIKLSVYYTSVAFRRAGLAKVTGKHEMYFP